MISETVVNHYHSKLEADIAEALKKTSAIHLYEGRRFLYEDKSLQVRRYTPDFVFPGSNIVLEAKGFLSRENRKKYLTVQKMYPEIDLRFVFQDAKQKLKGSQKSYAQWCESKRLKWSHGTVPEEWINEIVSQQMVKDA
jgi:hypothetical protein